jgi:hypothetical protein
MTLGRLGSKIEIHRAVSVPYKVHSGIEPGDLVLVVNLCSFSMMLSVDRYGCVFRLIPPFAMIAGMLRDPGAICANAPLSTRDHEGGRAALPSSLFPNRPWYLLNFNPLPQGHGVKRLFFQVKIIDAVQVAGRPCRFGQHVQAVRNGCGGHDAVSL